MKVIGLVGGVASGKSMVARLLAELGAGLLDADRAGHEVLANDAEVRQALQQRWGDAVLAPDGSVDRRAVAAKVFGEDDEARESRRFLEELLHPRIRRRLEKLREQLAAEGRPAVVLDAPLLLEAGWGPMCDVVLMVDSARETRLTRARERGWSEAEFERRESAQWPIDRKRQTAGVSIANDGTIDDLRDSVRRVWDAHVAH